MRCPNCSSHLVLELKNGFLGHWCNQCQGLCIPRALVPQLSRAIATNRARLWHLVLNDRHQKSSIHCPRCGTSMSNATVNSVRIKGCARCLCVWLDDVNLVEFVQHVKHNSLDGCEFSNRLS